MRDNCYNSEEGERQWLKGMRGEVAADDYILFVGILINDFVLIFIKLKYLMSTKKNFDANKYVKKNLDADTVSKLKEVFDVFDYDGSGQISTEELVNTIKALNLEAQAGQILGIVNAAGISGDFDFGTFLEVFGFGGDSTSEGTLQAVFEAFDTTGSGAFGPEEFQKVAASVGENFSAAEVDQMIEYADKDRDGVINFEEFSNVVTKVYPKV